MLSNRYMPHVLIMLNVAPAVRADVAQGEGRGEGSDECCLLGEGVAC